MRTASERPSARGGFTLLEAVAVIAVLGGVLLLAAPALPRPREGSAAAAHALAVLLLEARRDAALDGRTRSVEVDPASGGFRVATPGAEGEDSLLAEGSLALPDSVSLLLPAGAAARWRFGALGRAEGAAVELRDARGGERRLTVDAWTGRVRVVVP